MSETKVERETRPWTVFGQHADGTVNVSDGVNHQLYEHLHIERAKSICRARQVFLGRIKTVMSGKAVSITDGAYT